MALKKTTECYDRIPSKDELLTKLLLDELAPGEGATLGEIAREYSEIHGESQHQMYKLVERRRADAQWMHRRNLVPCYAGAAMAIRRRSIDEGQQDFQRDAALGG